MTTIIRSLSIALLVLFTSNCAPLVNEKREVLVSNSLNMLRSFETVAIEISTLQLEHRSLNDSTAVHIIDMENGEKLVSQIVDRNGDGTVDQILFQPKLPPLGEKVYEIRFTTEKVSDKTEYCYSRFVPERTDDFAWENNNVAFRTFGPTAQAMKEKGINGGTLSSGIDAWLKRVSYPIINKWYKKELETDGTYHEDTGEGLDNFHVGVSRGVGGIALKTDTTYTVSKNFVTWQHLYNGPIRTDFVLDYGTWDIESDTITEQKRISLDYGQQFSKFQVTLKGTDTISAGLTLHEKDGSITVNEEEGWISYWEPHEDSELGTAIIVPNNVLAGYEQYMSDTKDESNLFAHLKVQNHEVVYYAGFGWKKSGNFQTKADWENHVSNFSKRINHPLTITIK